MLPLLLALALPPAQADPMPAYDDAIALLHSPDTFCDGAARLAALGDPRALPPLVAAYESRAEGGKVCLLEAVAALDAVRWATEAAGSDDPAIRRVAARLPGMVADPRHVPALESLCADADDRVRATALRSLATQTQDAAWRDAFVRLLASDRADVRLQAATSLARRTEPEVRAALAARAAVETDPSVKAALAR